MLEIWATGSCAPVKFPAALCRVIGKADEYLGRNFARVSTRNRRYKPAQEEGIPKLQDGGRSTTVLAGRNRKEGCRKKGDSLRRPSTTPRRQERTHCRPTTDVAKNPFGVRSTPRRRLLAKRAGAKRYFGGPCHPCLRNAAAWPRNRYGPTSVPRTRQDCLQRGCGRTRGK